MAQSKVLLEEHLKSLRLPTFLREYDKLARQCAAQGVDFRTGKLPAPKESPVKVSGTPGKGSLAAYGLIRQKAKAVLSDRRLDHDLNALTELIESGELTQIVENETGRLYQ